MDISAIKGGIKFVNNLPLSVYEELFILGSKVKLFKSILIFFELFN